MASSSMTSKTLNEGKIAGGFQETAGGSLPRAYVTLLAGNRDNIMGVVCLAKGLRNVKSAYQLVVAFSPGFPDEHLQRLESLGCILRKIQPVYSTQLGCKGTNFSKLRLWDLNEYKKMIYLDPNVQVYGNIDNLFDYPDGEHVDCGVLYAVLDCFCEKTAAANLQDNINLCQKKLYFNDGMFVFEPIKKTFKYLIETLELIPPTPTPFVVQVNSNTTQRHFGHENSLQTISLSKLCIIISWLVLGLFEHVLRGVYKPISLIYNLNLPMLWNHSEHMDVVDLNEIKVVNYCAKGSLPWRYPGEEENMQREDVKLLVKKWWDVYNDESLDYKPPAQEDSLEPVRL
ncbi:galactinol synthase 1 [Cinnamomum micranthum f. kanehirae]|uniref:Hexosyltransferase n=1 Tax=Cinnamomum micranthum f. kanehirae TaxID=337451 RepID=A0A443PUF0_9MAGN|nr:galactinol synthase 1 [Cinnamomum micranthum f. kanehirae]